MQNKPTFKRVIRPDDVQRKLRLGGLLLLLTLLAVTLYAKEKSNLQTLTIKASSPAGEETGTLHFIVFDQANYTFEVIDNPNKRVKLKEVNLKSAVSDNNAVVGVNAGFFNVSKHTPVGLMIVNKVQTGAIPEESWISPGIVGAKETGELFLFGKDLYKPDPQITHLVQGGPWLVNQSVPFINPAKDRPNRRTFVGTDGKGKWIIGICESKVRLDSLAMMLISPEMKKQIEVTNVLNLDGGPSTGLAYNGPGREVYIEEGWVVRNFLLVREKKSGQ